MNVGICRSLIVTSATGLLLACSGDTADDIEMGDHAAELTAYPDVTYWDPSEPIQACFLADGSDLPVHEDWIRYDIDRTWGYVTGITVNWLSQCPATGSLIRIGLKARSDPSDGETGWTSGVGVAAAKDERATANANVGDAYEIKPSIKLYVRGDPELSSRNRMSYLAIHEFGHVLGFAHEQDHPDSTCEGDYEFDPITAYDPESVMNYCTSNAQWDITVLDREGAQSVYGVGTRYAADRLALQRWFSATL
jgi:hypothetical protein